MHPKSMSISMAHITLAVQRSGRVSERSLKQIMKTYGVTSPGAVQDYKDKLLKLGFLVYCPENNTYMVTAAADPQEIRIIVRPGIVADAFQRHLKDMLSQFHEIIEVSEVYDVGE